MGLARYALGTLELGLLVLGAVCVARSLRRRLLPLWTGVHALLVTVVVAVAVSCVALQLLGVVGLLRGWALGVAGAGFVLVSPKGLRRGPFGGAGPRLDAVSAGLLAALLAVWAVEIADVVRHGVIDVDSLGYHLPFAQVWAQTHRVGPLVHVYPGTPVQYYPGNGELLHAAGLVAYGRDVLGPYVNLGWLGLLALSGLALGARRGRVLSVLALVVTVAGGPLLAKLIPGGQMTDLATLAAVLAMAALVVEANDTGEAAALVPAGLAAGAAAGTKLTVLPLLGLVLVGLIAVRAWRWRPWWGFVGGFLAPCAFWYVRDWVLSGSPAPFLALPGLPSPTFSLFARFSQSVVHYAGNRHVIGHVLVPETYQVLGPAWWALIALFLLALVAAVRTRVVPFVVLALAALGGGLAYLVTPTTAGGPEGRPFLFAVDVRYALPTVLLAVCLLPLVVKPRVARWLDAVCVLAAAATLLAPWRLTADNDQVLPLTLVVGVAVGLLVWRRRLTWSPRLSALLAVVALVAAYPLMAFADRHAYDDATTPTAYHYVRNTHGLVVAVTGNLHLSPYAGRTLGNRVHYLGRTTPDGGFEDFGSCVLWRRAAASEHDDLLVVDGFARAWVQDKAFQLVTAARAHEPFVVRLVGTPDAATCPVPRDP